MASLPRSRIRGRFGVHWVTITKRKINQQVLQSLEHKWVLIGKSPVRWRDFTTYSYSRANRQVAHMTYLEIWRQLPTISTTIRTCMTNLWLFPGRQVNFTRTHDDISQPWHRDQGRTLPSSRTHTTWWHEDGSVKLTILLDNTVRGQPGSTSG